MPNITDVAILGATGSIGTSALNVIRLHPDRFNVVGLSAWHRTEALAALVGELSPRIAAVSTEHVDAFRAQFRGTGGDVTLLGGSAGLKAVAEYPRADTVVAGISGAAGLESTFAAVDAGKRILIANKEPLVMCGGLLRKEARRSGACLLPIDSEHNAIFQCLPEALQQSVANGLGVRGTDNGTGVERLTLTASGGPFLRTSAADLRQVGPKDALQHPTWDMGPKISVDSATLMNKGLELIEACTLFGLDETQVEVVIHPQSALHSVVHFSDGSLIGQMANPDMRVPIAYGLAYPERIASGVHGLDFMTLGRLEFESPDSERFPCLELARAAAREGGSVPTALNAANEIAVQAFLAGRLGFCQIPVLIRDIMDHHNKVSVKELGQVLEIDREVRQRASKMLADGIPAS
ncbi:MAG TPA: 1-deoxy-D-xylulose-5-phosphate reductoisomerase [Gammaproteobacteria bacterium]|jgi:1-deoxy-D-xylulose-5-phosphate reductoisomerase|nr:1-deoxy-D-xylulose-5-phosphate reductoisomerase [Acidiferrobacteraceae bacterium]MDP6552370.1 1-deoxy-D-xylulose-5-phosphate reductoisomerase [Arenicellales bacterium]MDP6790343.1 1-deoxy-D-xylulose-5-phosphate reductoisomerase [Arenicellales bacterium]MDP6918183.1 1-deoxy-D-xylulose-5-phosphate reductoisomerase [Arenicellales bacterium]HCX87547.1 1-deoxy-D-xylulose-5-phosphate reductoisomerase [Gammaproteobacteria bacterium]|tara:strand:+ start:37139 stop:38362 length:1224 start_codon:yes stop_codon:yes gene_type:complete